MDALSSQATVAGYKAVLLAAEHLPRFVPMLTTAAGTIRPAKVLVLGAGVAGLQAIATARRLGRGRLRLRHASRSCASRSRASARRSSSSAVEGDETSGGYATELSQEQHAREQQLIAAHVAEADAVITTAAIPGRPAPVLISGSAVAAMRDGSVIVDLAAETGGNCELTVPGEVVERDGVTIVGLLEPPLRDAAGREPDVLAERPVAARPAGGGRRARARLRRRDRPRDVRRPRRPGDARGGTGLSATLIASITVFALSVFLGIELISRVPTLLHTPLMSGTNAIHGVVLIGGMIILGSADSGSSRRSPSSPSSSGR